LELGIVAAMADYAEYLEDEKEELDEAEHGYRAPADAGSAAAMYACALIEDERGDSVSAEAFYRAAAERGFLPAIYDLGRILYWRDDPSWRLCHSICEAAGYVPSPSRWPYWRSPPDSHAASRQGGVRLLPC
jgi:TPR repeat protein